MADLDYPEISGYTAEQLASHLPNLGVQRPLPPPYSPMLQPSHVSPAPMQPSHIPNRPLPDRYEIGNWLNQLPQQIGETGYNMGRSIPGFKQGMAGVQSLLSGEPYQSHMNALNQYEEEHPTAQQILGNRSAVDPSKPGYPQEVRDQARMDEASQNAMMFSGGLKDVHGPGIVAAFRLPHGEVIRTGPFHDVMALPEPFRSGQGVDQLIAGFASPERFWTREETNSLLNPGAGVPKVPPGVSTDYPPPNANDVDPIAMRGTRRIGRINELGGFHEPGLRKNKNGLLEYPQGKYFLRPYPEDLTGGEEPTVEAVPEPEPERFMPHGPNVPGEIVPKGNMYGAGSRPMPDLDSPGAWGHHYKTGKMFFPPEPEISKDGPGMPGDLTPFGFDPKTGELNKAPKPEPHKSIGLLDSLSSEDLKNLLKIIDDQSRRGPPKPPED